MQYLRVKDPGTLNILIQGGLAGQARAEQGAAQSQTWDPEKTPMNGATQLLQWAADDATDPPSIYGPYNIGSPQQKALAVALFNDALDFFQTSRSRDNTTVTFSSNALAWESSNELKSLQDTLLKNDVKTGGQGAPSVRFALAEIMDNSFNQIVSSETGGGVALKNATAPRLADFARIEFGHYAGDSNTPDWISQYAAQAYGTHVGQLLSDLQQYEKSGSTTSLQNDFPGLFVGDSDTQAGEASSIAGALFAAMSSGITTDTVIVNGDDAARQGQQDRILAVLGSVLSAVSLVVPVIGEGASALRVSSLFGIAGAGASAAPSVTANDPNPGVTKGWDPVIRDAYMFHDALILPPLPTNDPNQANQASRVRNVVESFETDFSYFNDTAQQNP